MVSKRVICLYHRPIPFHAADSVQIMKMTQAFKKEGHDVTLFAPKAADFDGDLSALWERYGIDVPFPIQFIKGWKPLRWHDIALQSAWKARRAHAEVVFARSVLQAMYASWFGIPTIFDAHGPPGTRMAKLYLQLLFSGRGFRRLSVVTNTLKSVYLESYPRQLTPDQVVVDPNGWSRRVRRRRPSRGRIQPLLRPLPSARHAPGRAADPPFPHQSARDPSGISPVRSEHASSRYVSASAAGCPERAPPCNPKCCG
jgi:hypothetical protein